MFIASKFFLLDPLCKSMLFIWASLVQFQIPILVRFRTQIPVLETIGIVQGTYGVNWQQQKHEEL